MVFGCATNNDKTFKEQSEDEAPKHRIRPAKHIERVKEVAKPEESKKEQTTEPPVHLDEISRQKVQQFFDIYSLIRQNKQDSTFRAYSIKQASRLWVDTLKSSNMIQDLLHKDYDSLKINRIALLDITEDTPNESIGTYRIDLTAYRKSEKQPVSKKLRIYFANEDMMLEDQIVHTIKAKILEME